MTWTLSDALRQISDWLAPFQCVTCEGAVTNSNVGPFCGSCVPQLALQCQELDGLPLLSLGEYTGPLKLAIQRFKYGRCPELAAPLAALFQEHLERAGAGAQLTGSNLVAVPSHPARLVERGFNQAALLAAQLSLRSGIPYSARALRRTELSRPQAHLGRSDRRSNLSGHIQTRRLPPGPVALLDDVVTTGATARACIEACRAAGGQVAVVMALATVGATR